MSSSYRSSEKLIVTDGRNLVYFPPNEENEHKFSECIKRTLKVSDAEDKKIIKRLIEKAVDINIRKVTGKRMMQGIYLIEEPISLYRCERAKLYLGFSIRVNIKEKEKEQKPVESDITIITKDNKLLLAEVTAQSDESNITSAISLKGENLKKSKIPYDKLMYFTSTDSESYRDIKNFRTRIYSLRHLYDLDEFATIYS